MGPVLNTAQAARFLGLAPSTVMKMRMTEGGPVFLKMGTRVGYLMADLEAFLARNKHVRTGEYNGK